MTLQFEWDERKAAINYRKHGISFNEARTVFNDPLSITIADPEHSSNEERYLDIGLSAEGRVLVVIYTERASKIRLISCRKATPKERKIYEQP
ncbi:MAG TPA: BrnT family toxin [Candidatus Sericytochromatia bacterium]